MADFYEKKYKFPLNGRVLSYMLVFSIIIIAAASYAMSSFDSLQSKGMGTNPPTCPPKTALNSYAGSSAILGMGIFMLLFVAYVFFRGKESFFE